jgi:hypothetical protein
VLSTELSVEDYNSFLILTKLEHEDRLIKKSPSELLRFTIHRLLSQLSNDQIHNHLEQ